MTEVRLAVSGDRVDEVAAELAVVGLFRDERPLRGAAGQADWRLCGTLSRLARAGRLRGDPGEAALLPGGGGVRADQVLVLGLGERAGFDDARGDALLRAALERVLGLRVRSAALALPAAPGDEAPEAWVARILSGLAAVLGGAPDAELAVTWVVPPARHAGVQAALRRALVQPGAEGVRIRPAEAGPGRPPRARATARGEPESRGLRVK